MTTSSLEWLYKACSQTAVHGAQVSRNEATHTLYGTKISVPNFVSIFYWSNFTKFAEHARHIHNILWARHTSLVYLACLHTVTLSSAWAGHCWQSRMPT